MSETLLPKKVETEEPYLQRFRLDGWYGLYLPISTTVSEKGLGHAAGLELGFAESFFDSFSFGVEFDSVETEGRLLPQAGDDGGTFDRSHWALLGGMSKKSRYLPYFNGSGDLAGNFSLRTSSYIGGGVTEMGKDAVELEGEEFKFGNEKGAVAVAKQRYGLLYDIGLGERAVLSLGPELEIGAHYAGDNSIFNKMTLAAMLTVRIGLDDASGLPGGTVDSELGAMGIIYGLYSVAQGYAQSFMINAALTDAQEDLAGYVSMGGSERGSTADLPMLQAASALAGAGSGNLSTALRAGDWYFAFLAAQAAGAGFLASDGTSGKTAGVTSILGALRLSGYWMAGIHKPEARLTLTNEEVISRERWISLAGWMASAALFGIGVAAKDDTTIGAGAGGAMSVSMSPGLLERGLVGSMNVSLLPAWYVKNGKGSGWLCGVRIHNSWADFIHPNVGIYNSVMVGGPLYGDKELNSSASASMGIEFKLPKDWPVGGRFYLGPSVTSIYGGGDDMKGALGMLMGLDGIINITDNFALTLGGSYMLQWVAPKGGAQHDAAFNIGFEIRSGR